MTDPANRSNPLQKLWSWFTDPPPMDEQTKREAEATWNNMVALFEPWGSYLPEGWRENPIKEPPQ